MRSEKLIADLTERVARLEEAVSIQTAINDKLLNILRIPANQDTRRIILPN